MLHFLKTLQCERILNNVCYYQCMIRHSSARATINAECKTSVNPKKEGEDIESIAVPISCPPTVDVSLRSTMGMQYSEKQNLTCDSIHKSIWFPCPKLLSNDIISQYKKLSKFRLTSLVVITTMGGYVMAPAVFDIGTFLMCAIGTGLVSASANSINQYHEVPFDSQMSRTKNRVLVTGQLTPLHASGFALSSATLGLTILYTCVNPTAAFLGAGNLLLYTSIYTPLKRISILNTWVGSIVCAIPPLIGWAGCAGNLNFGAFILAGLLYAWQFPHFNALSWNLRPDYSRAGYRMMAVTNPDLCRKTAFRYTLVIGLLCLLAPAFDVTNIWFALESLPLNAYFAYLGYKFYSNADSGTSRKLFRFSLIHLPVLILLLLFNKKYWISDSKKANSVNNSNLIVKNIIE